MISYIIPDFDIFTKKDIFKLLTQYDLGHLDWTEVSCIYTNHLCAIMFWNIVVYPQIWIVYFFILILTTFKNSKHIIRIILNFLYLIEETNAIGVKGVISALRILMVNKFHWNLNTSRDLFLYPYNPALCFCDNQLPLVILPC